MTVPAKRTSLLFCQRGVAAIEFGLTLPILLAMTLGVYDASQLIARRIDYQQALTEAAGLAIAQPAQAIKYDYMKSMIASAASLPVSAVSVTSEMRCDGVVVTGLMCPENGDERALYVRMSISATYVPTWSFFAAGRSLPISITRVVRVQ